MKKNERIAALEAQNEVLAAMVVRASREVTPRLRANILEELEELMPDALDELRADDRPEAIRRRLS